MESVLQGHYSNTQDKYVATSLRTINVESFHSVPGHRIQEHI